MPELFLRIAMTKDHIRRWLSEIGKDRVWLAEQCGTTKSTVDGWFSTRGFPKPALVALERLMRQTQLAAQGKITSSFTTDEFELIEAARARIGNPPRSVFYHDAIMEKANRILATRN